jgi:hypothetical protein
MSGLSDLELVTVPESGAAGDAPLQGTLTDPIAANFSTWFNQGSSSLVDHTGAISLVTVGAGSGDNMHAVGQTAPSTPWTVTARVEMQAMAKSFHLSGVFIGDNASGRLLTCTIGSTSIMRASTWTTGTSFAGNGDPATVNEAWPWFKITDDGSLIEFSISKTGLASTWVELYSSSRTTWLSTPDRVGICAQDQNSSTPNYGVISTCQSWTVT